MCTDRKMTLAVTGGIGSGKSLVCSMFASKGIPVYDSDSRTKALYSSLEWLPARISEALGTDVCTPEGALDRKKLAAAVFSDPAKLSVLESIVHPEVRKDFLEWNGSFAGREDVPFVIIESAIILEKAVFRDIMDMVLVVDAPLRLRMDRTMARDGADARTVMQRMSSQKYLNDISAGIVRPEADFVIMNDGNIDTLSREVDRVFRILTGKSGKRNGFKTTDKFWGK